MCRSIVDTDDGGLRWIWLATWWTREGVGKSDPSCGRPVVLVDQPAQHFLTPDPIDLNGER